MTRRLLPPRRGLAMLLVLISLAVASIMASAYLASRDNSAAIGENVGAAAAARWASQSAAELGLAVLQTETDWREAHVDGVLIADLVIGDALVDVMLLDLRTNAPPTIATRHVLLSGRAKVSGIEQVTSIRASLPGDGDEEIDLDLTEFAVFADGDVSLTGDATIGRWERAPLSPLGERIAIGTNDLNGGTIMLSGRAAGIDVSIYHRPGASSGLVVNATGPAVELIELPDAVPLPEAPPPPDVPAAGGRPALEQTTPITIEADARLDSITMLSPAGVLTVRGDRTIVVEHGLTLGPRAQVIVDGDATLVVKGSLTLGADAAIELADGARLTAFVGGTVTLDGAYIGARRTNDLRDHTGGAAHVDPQRLRLYGTSAPNVPWRFGANSVVTGAVYAPAADVRIDDASALYGSVTAASIRLTDGASVFYDHGLDEGEGYTNFDGPLYDDGALREEVKAITSLDTTTVTALETSLKGLAALEPAPTTFAGQPTPRPVEVRCELLCCGADMAPWEARAAGF